MVGFTADLLETIIDNPNLLRRDSESNQNDDGQIMEGAQDTRNVIKNSQIIITGMTCASCQQTIETHLKSTFGILSATVSLLTHKAQIQYEDRKIGLRDIINEIEALGFEAKYEPQ